MKHFLFYTTIITILILSACSNEMIKINNENNNKKENMTGGIYNKENKEVNEYREDKW